MNNPSMFGSPPAAGTKIDESAGGGGDKDGPQTFSINRVMISPEVKEDGMDVAGATVGGRCALIQERRAE
jgi:hypothetical protein